jgi:hypothetical protein
MALALSTFISNKLNKVPPAAASGHQRRIHSLREVLPLRPSEYFVLTQRGLTGRILSHFIVLSAMSYQISQKIPETRHVPDLDREMGHRDMAIDKFINKC